MNPQPTRARLNPDGYEAHRLFGEMMGILNLLGRIISTGLGLLVLFLGVVWVLQAFNVAFNTPRVPGGPVSFMVNDHRWAVYGAIAAAVGIGQIVWSNTRLK